VKVYRAVKPNFAYGITLPELKVWTSVTDFVL